MKIFKILFKSFLLLVTIVRITIVFWYSELTR